MIELAPHHKTGLALNSPLMNVAGVLGFADEYRGLLDFKQLGAFVTNALTWAARTPARAPNAVPLPTGMVIHTGLPNPGVRAALKRHAPTWARMGAPIIVHLAATTPEDVRRSVMHLERAEVVSGIELGLRDDVTEAEAAALIRAARSMLPMLVCVPLMNVEKIGEAAMRAGANALTLCTPPRLGVRMGDAHLTGRYYSPTCLELTLELIGWATQQGWDVPLIGAGGIFSADAARQVLDAGATAVQVDAALWRDPENTLISLTSGFSNLLGNS